MLQNVVSFVHTFSDKLLEEHSWLSIVTLPDAHPFSIVPADGTRFGKRARVILALPDRDDRSLAAFLASSRAALILAVAENLR